MNKCGNCCYGVMTEPNRMFCSAQNCFCEEVFDCEDYEPIVKPITNADRIRSMTDEELADFLWSRDIDIVEKASRAVEFTYHCDEDVCRKNILDWLKEEAKE